jgi:hypothetical protein
MGGEANPDALKKSRALHRRFATQNETLAKTDVNGGTVHLHPISRLEGDVAIQFHMGVNAGLGALNLKGAEGLMSAASQEGD